MGRKKTYGQQLFAEAKEYFTKERYTNNVTRRGFLSSYRKYINYCRQFHDCKTKEDCENFIQEYIYYLEKQGYTASTIHSYTAPVVLFHGHSLKEFRKPTRHTSEYTKSRSFTKKIPRRDEDVYNPPKKYERSVRFAALIGCRRSELARICGDDLVLDESGNYAIRLKKCKGGKYQEQRVFECDLPFIKTFFEGVPPDEPIFKKEEISPRISYHFLRAKNAQRAYKIFYEMTRDPKGREKLEREVRARWNRLNISKKTGKPKYLPKRRLQGEYILRGKTRQFALEHGLQIRYDRLCVLAVSIFSLNHWRLDTSIYSYLIVI